MYLAIFHKIFIEGQEYKNVYGKKDLWKDLAEFYHGKFKIKQTVSKDINSFILEIPYKNHRIVLTESDTKPLKFEIELNLNRKFDFSIAWEDTVEKILKYFGKQDIQTGDKVFDRKYSIVSNEPQLVVDMLNSQAIGKTILQYNLYLLTMAYDEKIEKHKLMFVKDRHTKEKDEMIDLIYLEFSIIDFFIENNLLRN